MGKWDKLKTFIGIPDDSDVVGEDTAVETSEAEVKQPLTTAKKEAVRSASSAASSGVQGGKPLSFPRKTPAADADVTPSTSFEGAIVSISSVSLRA